MAAEFATSIASTIFDHSLGAIVRHVGYLWNHKKNLADLETRVNKLDKVRNDKSYSVFVAQRNAERIRDQVEGWQNDADKISLEARNIKELYEENAKKRCLIGLCPNVVSHYWLSRKAYKKQLEIAEAIKEADKFTAVSDRPVQRALSFAPAEGFLTFDSRNSILEKIMETMNDTTKNSIGLYGLGGMGKTTLAKQVASQAAEEKLFDEIVIAPVTKKPELKEIQGEIAQKLGLKLEESSVHERAGHIRERLKEKKVLVILDDLWENLDLEKVGIPFGPKHKGCKLLLTSRSRDVLSSMGTKKDFLIGALEEEEAWRLFEEKTADVIKESTFLDIGKKVSKRCKGLPVLIVTVAASLSSRQNLPAWKDALKELKKMNNEKVHEIVNSALEYISYNHLQEPHKRLFLLCGLVGNGFLISDLLKYCWGWNFFGEDVETMEEARNKLYKLILDLKASCLLLDGKDEDRIYIHDVVRGVAISLARKTQNMLCVGDGDTEWNRWPNDDVLRSCTAIFFRSSRDLCCLPERLECPSLKFCLLRGFYLDASSTISGTYFQNTRELRVLDMTGLRFSGLPSSLSCLENLQTLCLDYCTNLEGISIVGDLKKLQVLSLIFSDIKELPRGIGQLSELRLLDLTSCSELKIIPAGLLAKLSNLEELYMRESFNKWEAEGFHSSNSERSSNVSLAELKHLPKLHSLEIEVEDAKLLSQDFNFERLERYIIIAGDMFSDEEVYKKGTSRNLGMSFVTTGINHLHNGVKGLLKRVECLCLRELKGIKSFDELDGDGFTDLKYLSIQTDYEIQFIINVELKQQRAFPALESLFLSKLSKLEKICNGRLMQDSFSKLTTVNVVNCNKLESLFSFSIATGLPCLQELQVSGCSILKGIVAKKSNEDYNDASSEKIKFVQLRKLSLEGLPQLTSFCCSVEEKHNYMKIGAPSSDVVSEEEEPSSSISFFKEANVPSLEELSVKNCKSLKYLFTPSVASGLVRLQQMKIKCCPMMKKIVVNEGETTTNTITMPHLSVLCFKDLPNFTTFYSEDEEMCSNENIHIVVQPLFNDKVNLPVLKRLKIWNLNSIKSIWHNHPTDEGPFCNLCEVHVESCESLKCVFPAYVAQRLHQLEKLFIWDCSGLETVVKGEGDENKAVSPAATLIIFPKLTELSLEKLPKVKCFYAKKHALEWPLLNVLVVDECGKISVLDFLDFSEKQERNEFQKSLSKLEVLSIKGKDLKMMRRQYGHFPPSQLFPKLRELTLTKFDDGDESSTVFPSNFLYGLHSQLETLVIHKSSFEEIFPYEGEGEGLQLLFPHLTELRLEYLAEMKYICAENSPFFPILHKLNWLDIIGCPGLTNVVPTASLSFEFLIELTVVECGGLINLIPSSAAASLEQLEVLRIERCEMIEEILAADHHSPSHSQQDHHHEDINITFSKLEQLYLIDLPRLTSFCTANNHTLVFPELTEVKVIECPNMRTFSPGITITPMLKTVYTDGDEMCWNGDLNTTIQHVSSEMEAQRLTTTDPSTSSDNHVEPEAQSHEKPTESTGKEAEEIREVGKKAEISENDIKPENEIEPRNGADICEEVVEGGKVAVDSCKKGKGKELDTESCKSDLNTNVQHLCSEMEVQRVLATTDPTASPNNYIEPIESDGNEAEISMEASEPGNEAEVDAFEKGKGKAIEICEEEVVEAVGNEVQTLNHPFFESNMPEKSHLSSFRHMPFYERGESSVVPEQQSEKLEETTPPHFNTHEEQTGAGSLASQASTRPETSHSQRKDVQGLRGTKDSISLLSEFLHILQTQPLNSMRSEQFQFIEDAFRDLSNISIDWFSPYVEKAREFSLVVDRSKKISEIEAQLQALKEEKRALEEKNEAVASCVDLDKPLLDN